MRSLSISGAVPLDGPIDPAILQAHLLDNMRNIEARDIRTKGSCIEFTGGYFRLVTNWNILVPFGFGVLTVDFERRQVAYRLSYRQMAIFNVVIVVAMEMFFGVLLKAPSIGFLLALPFMLLFAGFISVVTGRARFERFLRRVVTSCPLSVTSSSRG